MPDPRSPRAAPGPDAGGAPPRPPVTLAARLALWFGGANLLVTVAARLAVSLYGRSLALAPGPLRR